MLEGNRVFVGDGRGRSTSAEDTLGKLYVDRDEVSRVLELWQQSSHPEASDRIREFESVLDSIEREIRELEGGISSRA